MINMALNRGKQSMMTTIMISKSPFHNALTFDSDELMIASRSYRDVVSQSHQPDPDAAFLTNDMPSLQVHACSSACADVLLLCRLKNTTDQAAKQTNGLLYVCNTWQRAAQGVKCRAIALLVAVLRNSTKRQHSVDGNCLEQWAVVVLIALNHF